MNIATYLGGLVHVHTRLSNYRGHRESDQTVRSYLSFLERHELIGAKGPWQYLVITNHVSNPVAPGPLGRLSLRARALQRRRWAGHQLGIEVMYGFEASLLAGGHTDLTPRLGNAAELVIASAHGGLEPERHDMGAYTRLLVAACENSQVDVLGHPLRGLPTGAEVEWPTVFAAAAATGTAVEINVNSMRPDADEDWLTALAASQAPVLIGYDLHNRGQLERLAADWHNRESERPNQLRDCVSAVAAAGIGPQRVVNRDLTAFERWMKSPKPRVFQP